jgi:hypothetical protein
MVARYLTLAAVLCITAACGGQAIPPQTGGPEVDVMTKSGPGVGVGRPDAVGHREADNSSSNAPASA